MLFNSISFLIFFPIVTLLYFLLPYKYRWVHLLVASCYFYMTFVPIYILILGGTIVIDYVAGILIEGSSGREKKRYLVFSLVANIGALAVFKYYNFFIDNVNEILQILHWNTALPYFEILLPIGLSFHTFQAMSYTIEVYRGNQKAERHIGIYALYVMFYPQLVAGPIERPQNILYQFYKKIVFDYKDVTYGLKKMAWGFFKKLVIADRLAYMVDIVYDQPREYTALPLLLASVFFAFQIYCDFSGYSDIAIGAARVMGFRLMTNFNTPYFATSVSDFWRRWHISLSTWFRDYLYIPMGGSRVPYIRWCFNNMTVFLISGFWHGASWTYIIWGGLHGAFIIVEKGINKIFKPVHVPFFLLVLRWFITFTLVCFAWIFFRASSYSDAIFIVKTLFTGIATDIKLIYTNITEGNGVIINSSFVKWSVSKSDYFWSLGVIGGLLVIEFVNRKKNLINFISTKPFVVRYLFYITLLFAILFFQKDSDQQFIYFQF
jgi:alginate O-acetyltransferase complex protein AlgI